MKPILVVANWKMNPLTLDKAKTLFHIVENGARDTRGIKVIICPPFVYLFLLRPRGRRTVGLGAQDCFWEKAGAYTGEISPEMLKRIGCTYTIVGHSERRKRLKETDEMINRKTRAVLRAGLTAILCVGENENERNQIASVLRMQLEKNLTGVTSSFLRRLVIAYEPIWAVGTGDPCRPDDAYTARIFIERCLTEIFGKTNAAKVRIIYGGSVTSKISRSYIREGKMDGWLVGGASLNAKEFIRIIDSVKT